MTSHGEKQYFDSSIQTRKSSERLQCIERLQNNPDQDTLWECIVAFQGEEFKMLSGLSFSYQLKKGRREAFTRELWIDRREKSKSLALSSILMAFHNIPGVGVVVERPKALGDIRGVSYIYGMFYRFGLIDVPDKAKEKMVYNI